MSCLNVTHDEVDCATAIAVDAAAGLRSTVVMCPNCQRAAEAEDEAMGVAYSDRDHHDRRIGT